MNRPLKFRIWLHSRFIYLNLKQGIGHLSEIAIQNSDSIFQQFTGLLDKNGKEIYEGDIIIFAGRCDEKGRVLEPDYLPYEVVWFMGGLHAIRPIGARSFYRHNECLGVGCTDSEIIGNIFETPELLNDLQ